MASDQSAVRSSFRCVPGLFDNNVPSNNIAPIYLINLPWKLGLGLGLGRHYRADWSLLISLPEVAMHKLGN